ncbi:MAG: S-layer homology domain-containing protein [Oscillospiraceae bacterium]|nr:S-layer homology domain-containing protein [Oscillospiraceae bacterium]
MKTIQRALALVMALVMSVSLAVTASAESETPPAPTEEQAVTPDPLAAYSDVDAALWYAPALRYVTKNGVMGATGDGTFTPNGAVTRGMVMTILARMEGVDTTADEGGRWYDKGVAWAKEQGVSDGTRPTASVTREEFATMLYRYEQTVKEGGFVGSWMFLLDNPDADQVSSWADEAMHWMTMHKVVNGVDAAGNLAPQSGATRAAVAQMLLNYSAVER